jgi:2-methylcitrate dehydratase PrpD
MPLLIEQLAEFVTATKPSALPPDVLDRAALSVLDTLAASVAGVATENAATMALAAGRLFGAGTSPVWFTGNRLSPGGAIIANCAAASALDIDDGHRGAAGHPGAAIIPAVLTVAGRHSWDGHRLLTAIVLGYDVALRVAEARNHTPDISFASGRWCGFGVATALGWLYGLDRTAIAHALAIAGAEAPQSLPQGASRNMGTVKGSSPWAASAATMAVERAQAGATGPLDLLDVAPGYDRGKITDDLGGRWRISETYLKPYGACRYIHPAIDAVLAMGCGRDRNAASLDEVTVEIFPEAGKITNDRAPRTLEAAQFSIPFCVALAALRGRAALRPLRSASLADAEVLAVAQRVVLHFSQEFAGQFPARTPARVRVRRGTSEETVTVLCPHGDVGNPLNRSDIEAKLIDLACGILPSEHLEALVHATNGLVTGSAQPLLCLLASAGRAVPDRAA